MHASVPFEQWYHDLHDICGSYDGVPRRGQSFVGGRIGVHAFDTLDVADVSGDVERIKRDRDGIRRDDAEHIFFVIDMGGDIRVDHNGNRSRLEPGDSLLLDSTREGDIFMAAASSRLLSVHLPRQSFLGEREPGLRIGEVLSGDNPAARSLKRHFFRFFRQGGGPENTGNATLLLDMIHMAFSKPDGGPGAVVLSRQSDRYDLALDLIDANLTAEHLTLHWLATRMGISSRQLQRVFTDRGTSFGETVRNKRFRFVTECLERLPEVHGRVAEIAFRAGFRDLSNFNRGFKARYGVSPRHYSRHGQLQRVAD